MKTTSSSLRLLPSAVAILAILFASAFSVRLAQAGYMVTLQQVGSDVVATGSGSLDLSGLNLIGITIGGGNPSMNPSNGTISTGPLASTALLYQGIISGPTNFGPGGFSFADSGTGDFVGLSDLGQSLLLPSQYSSFGPLSDTATYNNKTFTSLGVIPGTYVWSWGAGVGQNFTLIIPTAAVPDPASTLELSFLALIGLVGVRRLRLSH